MVVSRRLERRARRVQTKLFAAVGAWPPFGLFFSAPPTRVELVTLALGKPCSIQLSYGGGWFWISIEQRPPSGGARSLATFWGFVSIARTDAKEGGALTREGGFSSRSSARPCGGPLLAALGEAGAASKRTAGAAQRVEVRPGGLPAASSVATNRLCDTRQGGRDVALL
jgi:hypothetical protein